MLSSISEAIEDFRQGKIVIIVDDEDRENEGDLACAAEFVTPEIVNFMAREGRGLICLPMTEAKCDELDLPLQVSTRQNSSRFGTAFTVSIEAGEGVTTGISAADRAHTIRTAVRPGCRPSDLARPGHVFPLRGRAGGVLVRPGQTEASIDLARLAGLQPAAVICEVMNEDGTMARMGELERFASRFGLRIISVEQLVRYRLENEITVKLVSSSDVDTRWGRFNARIFENRLNGETHLALVKGQIQPQKPTLVRVHAQSILSDVFDIEEDPRGRDLRCALELISREGEGAVVYLRQELAGRGLADQIRALSGAEIAPTDKARSNSLAVFEYGIGAQILHEIGAGKLRLLTNHPPRLTALPGFGLEIVETVPLTLE